MRPLVTNIQRFCVHDGPGIRTTVFFKGCSLHCPWCANPENINTQEEYYYIKEKCSSVCKRKNICKTFNSGTIGKTEIESCAYGAIGCFGKCYSPDELYQELIKDYYFYSKEGGVTFSGGEPLLFLEQFEKTVDMLHHQGINICVETALNVPTRTVKWAASKKIDYFYVDIKSVKQKIYHDILGGDENLFMSNLEELYNRVPRSNIVYRIPLVQNITCTEENILEIASVMQKFPPDHIEIFSVHNLGKKKYERLLEEYRDFDVIEETLLKQIQESLAKSNVRVVINNI